MAIKSHVAARPSELSFEVSCTVLFTCTLHAGPFFSLLNTSTRNNQTRVQIGDVFLNVSEASGADSLLGEHEITGHRGVKRAAVLLVP